MGDYIAHTHGNEVPEGEFDISGLNSFIIIKDDELPDPEKFVDEELFLVIPILENE